MCDFPDPACAVVKQLLMHFEAQGAQLHPVQMSYNNYLDGDAAFSAACDFLEPTCVVVKHTNPCGAASRPDLLEAYRLAVRADPISAFGGIVAFNRRAWAFCTSCKSSGGNATESRISGCAAHQLCGAAHLNALRSDSFSVSGGIVAINRCLWGTSNCGGRSVRHAGEVYLAVLDTAEKPTEMPCTRPHFYVLWHCGHQQARFHTLRRCDAARMYGKSCHFLVIPAVNRFGKAWRTGVAC